ncbi:Cell division control protein 48-like protein C [Dichanthelium oligosanthes]|uniref:Cell division control protein 48-like protein C n=1 Tax=Dichanthelium oligosanthes TaxID=888268 RepID=A0A1E5VHL1_9POAL|nr:Cell division control protein 48-like protein C [Dichanthelium oligosanthes]
MGKRPRHKRRRRTVLVEGGGLTISGSSAEDHQPESRRQKVDTFTAAVRRVPSAVPSPSSGSDDDDAASRRRHDANTTTSSCTSLSADESVQPPPPPAFDLTKTILRSQYASQTPKRNPGTIQQLEVEVTAEKPRRLITSDGGGGGDAKPDAPAVEGVARGEKGPRFADLGGMEAVIEQLMMEMAVPLCHPELPQCLGVRPVAGLLLHGPPGCGKTTLAHAIANETGVPFYKISAPEVVSGVSGASEENMRGLFQKAYRTAPSIVFIDEIDAIASKRENLQREMERRIVTQLMTCMDEFHQNIGGGNSDAGSSEKKPGYVIVIGATNRPDAVDQALRRPGRFDREISLGIPDENAWKQILKMLTQNLRLEGQFDLFKIARATPAKMVQPSLRREGFSSVPDVTWDDVGGLDSLRKEFDRCIVRCIKNPEDYEVDALTTNRGNEGGCVVERVVNQLLTELEDQRQGVYVIGATNRIDVIDDALLRPGRFGKKHYVPLPGADERVSILKARARSKPISSGVDLDALARREECSNLTGADLASLHDKSE